LTNEQLFELARELDRRAEAYALVTVVRAIAPTSAWLGAQAIVLADGTLHGWIGGGCAQGVVIAAARSAIAKGQPRLVRISNDRIQGDDEVEQHAMQCASSGTIELFIQPYSARSALCVLGRTPAADEARFLAERYRIRLTESPGEAPVVLVATQGQGDEEALEAALRSPARHVLMIASRRKAETLRTQMRESGVSGAQLARLQAPAGADAGAKTPGEIALVAIVAVLALLRRGEAAADAVVVPDEAGAAQDALVDPVCGMVVAVGAATTIETYEGMPYYFCCGGCRTTFCNDPAKYAASHRASMAGAAR
jgi:xanthine dehydrogenase accessory factor